MNVDDMTPDEIAQHAQMHAALYKKTPAKRKGQTPEAKVSQDIDRYLEQLDFYVLRTSAGLAEFGGRKLQIGRAGTHDRTCCAPNGCYVSIEIKSADGSVTPAQQRQRGFIERRQGLVIVARSAADVRQSLVERFGEATVAAWEASGKTRRR